MSVGLQQKKEEEKVTVEFQPLHECGKFIMYSDERIEDRLPSRRVRQSLEDQKFRALHP